MQHLTIAELKLLLQSILPHQRDYSSEGYLFHGKRGLQKVEPFAAMSHERQRLMIKTTFHHGLRVSEALSLDRLSIRDGFLTVQRLKGSLPTTQRFVAHLDPDLDEAVELTELARTLKPKERLFNITRFGFYKLMHRAGERAGLPHHKCHPHVLKHSTAMQSIKQGIEFTRQRLGHVSIGSTGAYLKVSDEAADDAYGRSIGAIPRTP